MDRDEPARIRLADAIAGVRAELADAVRRGEGQEPRFAVGPIEMEFTVEIRNEGGVDGGVRVWVLSAGGRRTSGESHTQRLLVKLVPLTVGGEPWHVASDSGGLRPRPASD